MTGLTIQLGSLSDHVANESGSLGMVISLLLSSNYPVGRTEPKEYDDWRE